MAILLTGSARQRRWRRNAIVLLGVAVYALLRAPASTQPAVADGDTRTLSFVNRHTNEAETFTYRVNGQYDEAALEKINWFMRDWRINEQTKIDPKLLDIVWEVYRQSRSEQPIDVLSAYRSPQTNSMLRRRSRLVAEHSQHMQGKAMDAHFQDVGPGQIRDIAMRMQEGGVGFYPIGSTPWVHIDSGAIRYWPRMSRASMARLFPDGKTVFIPADGQPMAGYEEAKAMIETRGGEVVTASASGGGGLLGWLFGGARGGGADDDEEQAGAQIIAGGGRGGAFISSAASGRGSPPPALSATAPAEPAPAPAQPAPVETPVAAAAPDASASQEAATQDVATAAPENAGVAQDAPEEPVKPIRAPRPPRRPASFVATASGGPSPAPPRRPAGFATSAQKPTIENKSSEDAVAALIERNALPAAITHGARPTPPKSALALVDGKSAAGGGESALARAATLAAPLPPARPHPHEDGVSVAEKAPLPPPRPSKTTRPAASNPFGGLVVEGFSSPGAETQARNSSTEVRQATP